MDVNSDQADLALLLQQPDTFPHYTNYQPLDKATRPIRLLQIRREFDGKIHATIVHASLDDDQIEYEALSYCWGSPTTPRTILIDHEALPIRSSLYAFLDALCQNNQSIPIWVDSICINQRDVHERNWQVSMMGDIYRRATRVKSWIGPSDAYSEYIFAYMNCYSDEAFISSSNSARAKEKALESLQMVLDRPYWKRLWVVQEMTLARELLIMCGTRVVSWEGFLDAYKQNFPSGHIVHTLSDFTRQGSGEALALANDRSASAAGGPKHIYQPWMGLHIPRSSLLAQMERFGAQACEDSRDRIFGLLSISENGDQIVVDYTKSLADVMLGAILTTYHVSLGSRPHIAARYQHAVPRQELDVIEKIVSDKGFEIFANDVKRFLRPTGLLSMPDDLLCSLSTMEDCLAICPRVFAPTHPFASYQPRSPSVVFDREDEEIPAEEVCTLLGDGIFDRPLVHWGSHEVAPRIVGCMNSYDYDSGVHRSHVVSRLLLEMGEIQLCSQVRPATIPPMSIHPICGFSIHFSPFAVLAIICADSLRWPTNKDIDANEACLRDRRGKYPRPKLCACEVSAELNQEAFRLFKWQCELITRARKKAFDWDLH